MITHPAEDLKASDLERLFFLDHCQSVAIGRPRVAACNGQSGMEIWGSSKVQRRPSCDAKRRNGKPHRFLNCLACRAPVSGFRARRMSRVSLERSGSNVTIEINGFLRASHLHDVSFNSIKVHPAYNISGVFRVWVLGVQDPMYALKFQGRVLSFLEHGGSGGG